MQFQEQGLKAAKRIWNRNLSAHQWSRYADKVKASMPSNGGPTSGGIWPKFEGHFFEEAHVDAYNRANAAKGKELILYPNGTQANFDAKLFRDGRAAESVQIKLGTGAIKRAVHNMEQDGKKAKKAILVVPKDMETDALRIADKSIKIEASPLSRVQVRRQAQLSIKHATESLRHEAAKTLSMSMAVGSLFDLIPLYRGKLSSHDFAMHRARDFASTGLSIILNRVVTNTAIRGVGLSVIGKPAFIIAANPWLISAILTFTITKGVKKALQYESLRPIHTP